MPGPIGAQGIPGPEGQPGPVGIQGAPGATGGNIPPFAEPGLVVQQVLDQNGNPTSQYTIGPDTLIVPTQVSPPTTSSDPCSANQFSYDKAYYYFCSPDGWARIPVQRGW